MLEGRRDMTEIGSHRQRSKVGSSCHGGSIAGSSRVGMCGHRRSMACGEWEGGRKGMVRHGGGAGMEKGMEAGKKEGQASGALINIVMESCLTGSEGRGREGGMEKGKGREGGGMESEYDASSEPLSAEARRLKWPSKSANSLDVTAQKCAPLIARVRF